MGDDMHKLLCGTLDKCLAVHLDDTGKRQGDVENVDPRVGLVFDVCGSGALVRVDAHKKLAHLAELHDIERIARDELLHCAVGANIPQVAEHGHESFAAKGGGIDVDFGNTAGREGKAFIRYLIRKEGGDDGV